MAVRPDCKRTAAAKMRHLPGHSLALRCPGWSMSPQWEKQRAKAAQPQAGEGKDALVSQDSDLFLCL